MKGRAFDTAFEDCSALESFPPCALLAKGREEKGKVREGGPIDVLTWIG
jgi:hypothetical protein